MNILFSKVGKLSFLSILLVCSKLSQAQQSYVNKLWIKENAILGPNEIVTSEIDLNGNLFYVTNNTVNDTSHIFLTCISQDGNINWEVSYPANSSTGNDYGIDIEIDNLGNSYICGARHNGYNYDYLIAKYSFSGLLLWEQSYNGIENGDDIPAAIKLDNENNLFVTGSSSMEGLLMTDYSTLKLNGINGNIIWQKTYNLEKPQVASCLAVKSNGDIVVSGSSFSSLSNADILTLTYSGIDGSLLNYDSRESNGDGQDVPNAITINANDKVYIVGTSKSNQSNSDIKIIAYSNNLDFQWDNYIDKSGNADEGLAITTDTSGNPIITGYCTKLNGGTNLIVYKFDGSNGNILWERERSNSNEIGLCKGFDLAKDSANIFISGVEEYDGINHFLTMCLSSDGVPLWSRLHNNNSSNSQASQIKIKDASLVVTGRSTIDGEKNITSIKYSTQKRPGNLSYVNGKPSHIERSVLARFSDEKLNFQTVNNKNQEAGLLEEFIDSSLIVEMSNKTGFDWKKLRTFKVHRRASAADSLSITRLGDTIDLPNFWASLIIEIPSGFDEKTVCDSIQTNKYIFHSSPNYIGQLTGNANDEYYLPGQAGFNNSVAGINVDEAWDMQTGQENVKVGIYDAIVDWSHPDFGDGTMQGSKVVGGVDYTAADFQNAPNTSLRHGTAVAGIIGALRNNDIGVAGVAGGDSEIGNTGAQILSFGIFKNNNELITNNFGYTDFATIAESVVEGSVQTTNGYGYGLHIQNHSWGTEVAGDENFQEAFEIAFRNHCIVVAARGNSGSNGNSAAWPACDYDKLVLSVVASGTDGQRKTPFNGSGAWSSSYGLPGGNNNIRCDVDVLAPGAAELIATTIPTSSYPYNYPIPTVMDPLYTNFDGTSAAAPHVSGVAALMYSQHNTDNGFQNNLVLEDIEAIMEKTSSNEGVYDLESGYGLLNALSCLEQVSDPYYIKHVSAVPVYTELIASNLSVSVFGDNYDVPQGIGYLGQKYKVDLSISEELPLDHEIIDLWEFTGNTSNGCHIYNSPTNMTLTGGHCNTDQVTNVAENTTELGGNIVNCNVTTYTYRLTKNNQYYWYPCSPSDMKYSFSLHVKKQNEAAIQEIKPLDIKLYPNPSIDYVRILINNSNTHKPNLLLTDATGKNVLNKCSFENHNESIDLNIQNLKVGIYYCKVVIGDVQRTLSFIKLK